MLRNNKVPTCPRACPCWARPGEFSTAEQSLLGAADVFCNSALCGPRFMQHAWDAVMDCCRRVAPARLPYVLSVPLAGFLASYTLLYFVARRDVNYQRVQTLLDWNVCMYVGYSFHARGWSPHATPAYHPGRQTSGWTLFGGHLDRGVHDMFLAAGAHPAWVCVRANADVSETAHRHWYGWHARRARRSWCTPLLLAASPEDALHDPQRRHHG